MALTVPTGFSALLADLNLTPTQKSTADGRILHLDSWFRANVACSTYPTKIGSYGRDTLIRWRRDIDVMVVLAYDPYWAHYGTDSAALLRWLRDRLNDAYGQTQVSTREVAIRMFLGDGLQVDLVPLFARQGGGYLLPNGKGGWRATNPLFHASFMTQQNVRLEVRLKPLVRLMKAWNEANGRHLHSFHLEIMVEQMWESESSVPDYPTAMATALRKATTYVDHPQYDPWLEAGLVRLDDYLSTDERARLVRMFAADRKRADDALTLAAAGKSKDAYEKWKEVFPGRFPAYG
jgi:hypothetical protein